MRYALALLCALIVYALISVKAQAGFISCTAENGKIFLAGLDGEANVSNLRVIDVKNQPGEYSSLELEAISFAKSFLLIGKLESAEESVIYTIRANKKNGVFEATFTEQAGQFSIIRRGTCIVDITEGF